MNILQVVPELNAGGVERTTIEIVQALTAAGHGAHVASQGGRMESELQAAGGVLHTLPMGSKNPFLVRKHTRALVGIIKAHNIDLVHVRSRAPAWAARAAAKVANIPFITTYHGIYNAKSNLKRRYNAIMAKGDIIIANSHYTKAHIIKEHGTDADRITVIQRGVDIDIFDLAKISAADIKACRKAWGVDAKASLLLLPGRLTRWKGQLVAIKALATLDKTSVLVLLGDAQGRDDYVTEIKDLTHSLGLEGRVILAPHTVNMATAYASADVVISASTDPEAFGRVAAEAQAMHTLVVATAHGGALETVVDGETGFLVAPNDATALAKGIAQVLGMSKVKRNKLGKAARTRIQQQFSAKTLKNATLSVYEKAIHQAKP